MSCSKPSPTSEKNIRCVWRVESQEISIWCCMMAICKSKRKIITNLKFTWHWSSHSTRSSTEFSSIRSSELPLVASLISCITTYLSLCSYLQWIFQFPKVVRLDYYQALNPIAKSQILVCLYFSFSGYFSDYSFLSGVGPSMEMETDSQYCKRLCNCDRPYCTCECKPKPCWGTNCCVGCSSSQHPPYSRFGGWPPQSPFMTRFW